MGMAKILCVWEQGGNFSHLGNLRIFINMLLQQGHQVFLAARELHGIPAVFGTMPIHYLQAPFKQNAARTGQSPFLSYTHMLREQCFSTADELDIYVRVWRNVFAIVQPDMVIYEHSPTALVASVGYSFRKVLAGNGFMCPPVEGDTFAVFPTTKRDEQTLAQLQQDDAALLQVINSALQRHSAGPLARLADIYAQADQQFLQTFPELDQFGARPDVSYLGAWSLPCDTPPQWPAGGGVKVFGYLQMFPGLEQLLKDLQAADVCALLYIKQLPTALKQKYTSDNIAFTEKLVDLRQVARQARFALTHGNHATLAYCMVMGIPQLAIPRFQEQLLSVLRLEKLGCGLHAYQDQQDYGKEIAALLHDESFKQNADVIRLRYSKSSAEGSERYIADRLAALLSR